MTQLPESSRLDGKPSGPNCGGRYPWAKRCREYVAPDVKTAVHIGMDGGTAFDAIPATSTPTREVGLLLLLGSPRRVIDGQRVQIQEAGFAGIALFRDQHLHAARLGFVREEFQ